MADIFGVLYVILPDVPRNDFGFVAALGAICKVGTIFADVTLALVFAVTVPVRGGITQNLIVRAQITVMILIVNIIVCPVIWIFFPYSMGRLYGNIGFAKSSVICFAIQGVL